MSDAPLHSLLNKQNKFKPKVNMKKIIYAIVLGVVLSSALSSCTEENIAPADKNGKVEHVGGTGSGDKNGNS